MPSNLIEIRVSVDNGAHWFDTEVSATSTVGQMVLAGGRYTTHRATYEWPGWYQVEGGS